MRRYWHAIKNLEGLKGAALRLHLLTGGQRIEQLCDLLPANVGKDSIVLMDGKGRPGRPARAHLVPLLPLAREALAQFQPKGSIVLSTDNGKTRLQATTLSRWAQDVAASTEAGGRGIDDAVHVRADGEVWGLLAKAP